MDPNALKFVTCVTARGNPDGAGPHPPIPSLQGACLYRSAALSEAGNKNVTTLVALQKGMPFVAITMRLGLWSANADEDGVACLSSQSKRYCHVTLEAGVLGQPDNYAVEPIEPGDDGQRFNRKVVSDVPSVHQ